MLALRAFGRRLARSAPRPRVAAAPRRPYHFASSAFDSCLERDGIPDPVDTAALRRSAVEYLDSFDPQTWYDEPVTTLLKGDVLDGGAAVDTVDAFHRANGRLVEATPAQVEAVIKHVDALKRAAHAGTAPTDLRAAVRKIEAEFMGPLAGLLIGNQAVDFQKQDGVTEIEESLQANVVEQRLQDQLLADEAAGHVKISRAPAFVGCVSNFSNFLDLCRKVLRNVELGVPVVILSRANTTQHMYRWAKELVRLCEKHGVDSSYVTYFAAPLADQQRLLASAGPGCPMYFTGSREVASSIKAAHGNLVASTGGPNTFITTAVTPQVEEAIRCSASIENSGQCTALRHVVAADVDADVMERLLGGIPVVTSPRDSLLAEEFSGVFDFAGAVREDAGSAYCDSQGAAGLARYTVRDELPPPGIQEHWRNVVVDVTQPPAGTDITSDEFLGRMAEWLVDNQPITVAFNGDYGAGRRLWERTGQVVFTVGTLENPALTCQARPQDGEVFGEFPVRRELAQHTTFPVIVPSPTPGYNTYYDGKFLRSEVASGSAAAAVGAACDSAEVSGYLSVVEGYLRDACGPKRGRGVRSTLYGLQTPPQNGQLTQVRIGASGSFDDAVRSAFPLWVTSARAQLSLSVHPANEAAVAKCRTAGFEDVLVVEDDAAFDAALAHNKPYNVVRAADAPPAELPLVGQFVSTLLCVGHVKSTASSDDAFFAEFEGSSKWLTMHD